MSPHINNRKLRLCVMALFVAVFASFSLIRISTFAAPGYIPYTPGEIIADESLYETAEAIVITEEEKANLAQIDLNAFDSLKDIWLQNVLIDDGSIIDIDRDVPIERLLLGRGAVVGLSTIDLDDFKVVSIAGAYSIGPEVPGIDYSLFVNEEYQSTWAQHDEEINVIAEEIYRRSDGTPRDIIRQVTIYVLENMEYGYAEVSQGFAEDALYQHIGVCAHYAHFENILLNKLGIFSITAYSEPGVDSSSNHAFNILYTDGSFYQIDSTWLDLTEGSLEALKMIGGGAGGKGAVDDDTITERERWEQNPLRYYMASLDDDYFNEPVSHRELFTGAEFIPEAYRVSRMSIISRFEPEDEPTEEEPAEKESANTEPSDVPSVPNTGFFFKPTGEFDVAHLILAIFAGISVAIFTYITFHKYAVVKSYIHGIVEIIK